jgi:hypothetical protein
VFVYVSVPCVASLERGVGGLGGRVGALFPAGTNLMKSLLAGYLAWACALFQSILACSSGVIFLTTSLVYWVLLTAA